MSVEDQLVHEIVRMWQRLEDLEAAVARLTDAAPVRIAFEKQDDEVSHRALRATTPDIGLRVGP